ncbi:hypothetical protein B0A48_13906 [Cryoendolithus antarcticus]|uniref:Uncharacterized protein n=1 Tax=Cryoendolithus antarcticus TaxID=1507870 RepID=A0A1V8SLW6_9PEZI|nr:hypothetical protein B0A48_13906 [Cryoendolithus antarcticus]
MVSNAPNFTDRERSLIATAFECLKSKADIDYETMAKKAGLKGTKSARDCFGPIMKKLMAGTGTASPEKDAASTTGGETPKKRGVKRGVKRKGDVEAGGEMPAKKKATPRRAKKVEVAAKESEGEDDDEEGKEGAIKGEQESD